MVALHNAAPADVHAPPRPALAVGGDEERRARPYDGFTLWREDNFFFTPLPEQFVPFDAKVDVSAGAPGQQKPQPAVVVDQYCGWGALSDKIFAANAAGAALLFDPTWAAFVAKMKAYAREATLRRSQGLTGVHQKFHPENWYQVVMARGGTRVEKRDLRRADVRYVLGRFCATKVYAHCSPAGVGSGIPVCPGVGLGGKRYGGFARWVLASSLAQLKRDPLRMAADFDKVFVVGRLKPGAVKRVRVARQGRAKDRPSAADLLAGRGVLLEEALVLLLADGHLIRPRVALGGWASLQVMTTLTEPQLFTCDWLLKMTYINL